MILIEWMVLLLWQFIPEAHVYADISAFGPQLSQKIINSGPWKVNNSSLKSKKSKWIYVLQLNIIFLNGLHHDAKRSIVKYFNGP